MEDDFTPADAKLLAAFFQLLADFQLQLNVELAAVGDLLLHVFTVDDVVHRGTEARPQEAILHLLAHNRVVAAALREQVHARSDFRVAQQGRSSHGVVPVAVDALERQDCGKACGVQTLHRDARTKRVGQPDERTDLVPEVVSGAEPAHESFEPLKQRQSARVVPAGWKARCLGQIVINLRRGQCVRTLLGENADR